MDKGGRNREKKIEKWERHKCCPLALKRLMEKSIHCPLCLEELDQTDLSLKPCLCGYQVCLYCLHYIREQQDGKCPACRTPYTEDNFSVTELDPQIAAKLSRKRMKKTKKERLVNSPKASLPNHQKDWKRLRIIQRNLVCVKGLALSLCRAHILRSEQFFGAFGNLLLVLVDRGPKTCWEEPCTSASVYLLYETESAASAAVQSMHNKVIDEKRIQVSLATTKYCNAFLEAGKPQWCDNPYCLYRHEPANPEDVVTVDSLQSRGLSPPPPHYLFSMKKFRRHFLSPPGYNLPTTNNGRQPHRDEDTSNSVVRNIQDALSAVDEPCKNNGDIGNGDMNRFPMERNGWMDSWNTLEYLSSKDETLLLDNMANIGSLEMSSSRNRMSSRFDFLDNESLDSDDSLSPSDSDRPTGDYVGADSVAWNPSAVDNDDEWITTERRLELMFGNDIVHHHFVTVDALPSLNDLLTRLQSSKKDKEEELKTRNSFDKEAEEEQAPNSCNRSESTVDRDDSSTELLDDGREQVEHKPTAPRKRRARKKKKQNKAKSEENKDSSVSVSSCSSLVSSMNDKIVLHENDVQACSHRPATPPLPSQEQQQQRQEEENMATTTTITSNSASARGDDERGKGGENLTKKGNPSSQTLREELQAMKEKEMQLQKRLEQLQNKLEKLLLL